jgi:hypothetical protein
MKKEAGISDFANGIWNRISGQEDKTARELVIRAIYDYLIDTENYPEFVKTFYRICSKFDMAIIYETLSNIPPNHMILEYLCSDANNKEEIIRRYKNKIKDLSGIFDADNWTEHQDAYLDEDGDPTIYIEPNERNAQLLLTDTKRLNEPFKMRELWRISKDIKDTINFFQANKGINLIELAKKFYYG